MSLLVDTNLLVYAALPAMDEHRAARSWLRARFDDRDSFVGLCWPALYAFVRLVANPQIMGTAAVPLPDAWNACDDFRRQPTARLVQPGAHHHRIAAELVTTPGLAANDVPDVQIAALAVEHGLTLCTHDHGFARFPRLHWSDPLTAA